MTPTHISTRAFPNLFSRTMYDARSYKPRTLGQKALHFIHLVANRIKRLWQNHASIDRLAQHWNQLGIENIRCLSSSTLKGLVQRPIDARQLFASLVCCYVAEKRLGSVASTFKRLLDALSLEQVRQVSQLSAGRLPQTGLDRTLARRLRQLESISSSPARALSLESLDADLIDQVSADELEELVEQVSDPNILYGWLAMLYSEQSLSQGNEKRFNKLLATFSFEQLDALSALVKQPPVEVFMDIQRRLYDLAASLNQGLGVIEDRPFSLDQPLHGLWQFWSDHLPVGGTLYFSGHRVTFGLWNLLHSSYLKWIEGDDQGLKGSWITSMNSKEKGHLLTQREEKIVAGVLQMVDGQKSPYPRSVLALEELSPQVYKAIQAQLPPSIRWACDTYSGEDAFLYDASIFDLVETSSDPYSEAVHKRAKVTSILLREKRSGQLCQFIQSHVPGGPTNSSLAHREFASIVMRRKHKEALSVVLGDMNREIAFLMPYFEEEARFLGVAQPFVVLKTPYRTHVNTRNQLVYIDNLLVAVSDDKSFSAALSKEFLPEVETMAKLFGRLEKRSVGSRALSEAGAPGTGEPGVGGLSS